MLGGANIDMEKDIFTVGIWMEQNKLFDDKPVLYYYWLFIATTITFIQAYYLEKIFEDVIIGQFYVDFDDP